MIVRDHPGLVQVLLMFRGSVLSRIWPQVLLIALLSVGIVSAHRHWPDRVPVFNGAPLALFGVALSVFMGFRNSACYDRWWEARRQWGQLLATSRDLARQTLILEARGEKAARERLLRLIIVFAHALVDHLRRDARSRETEERLEPEARAALQASLNGPAHLLRQAGGVLAELLNREAITPHEWAVLDGSLGQINAVLAACERLRSTPVPFGYSLLLLRTAYIFCFMVPFGFAEVLGWVTPLAGAVFAYTFFGLDVLGDELEEPFGNLPNDLPIRSLAIAIEIGLREALGDRDLPPMPAPVDHVLM